MSKNWMRWLPAAVAPAVVVSAAIAIPAAAGAAPTLPEKSPDQVLAMIADSTGTAYSGTIEQQSDLGIPELPSSPGSSASATGALEFLTGSHTLRAFVRDRDTLRLQVLDDMAERNVVRNGDEVWLYDSSEQEAVNLTFPEDSDTDTADTQGGVHAHPEYTGPSTPAEVAERLIEAIEPSTSVTVGTAARVAGRSVYQLSLDPKSPDTLVDGVVLSVDSETGLPLRVEVAARGQEQPAFSIGFSAVDFEAPYAALFEFTPPAGATVTTKSIDTESIKSKLLAGAPLDHGSAAVPAIPDASTGTLPTVIGSGWDAIVALPAMEAGVTLDGSTEGGDTARLFEQLTTPVDGGRMLGTALVTVLLTDDGRVFAGAVPVERLQAAAAGPLER